MFKGSVCANKREAKTTAQKFHDAGIYVQMAKLFLAAGYTEDEILRLHAEQKLYIKCNGINCHTVQMLESQSGKRVASIEGALKKGKTMEEAVLPSFSQQCHQHNIKTDLVRLFMSEGITLEEIFASADSGKNYIEYEGEKYYSANAFARTYNIDKKTISRRLSRGCSVSTSIDRTVVVEKECVVHQLRPTAEMYGWDNEKGGYVAPSGEVYKSINSMCRAYGKYAGVVRHRLMNGASLEQALTLDKYTIDMGDMTSQKRYGRNDDGSYHAMKKGRKKFSDIQKTAKSLGIPAQFYRILCDYDIDARTWVKEHQDILFFQHFPVMINGSECNTATDVQRAAGASTMHAIYSRMIRYNCTVQEAVKDYESRNSNDKSLWGYNPMTGLFVAPDGKEYKSRMDMCNAYGISYKGVLHGLNSGKTLEQALTRVNITKIRKVA